MSESSYRYRIEECVPIKEAEITLILSLIAVESLHGESQARLDASHAFDAEQRTVTIDASTVVGRDLNRLFAGFLAREFGGGSFRVERVPPQEPKPQPVTV
jgi:hypothetical protein